MQHSDYLIQAQKVYEQYEQYKKDLAYIFDFSTNISKEIVKYILKTLKEQNNPEIGKVLVEVALAKKISTLTILKVIVKTLYVIGHIPKYKHSDYYSLKKHIDSALEKDTSSRAFMARKKYELLLSAMNKEDPPKINKQKKQGNKNQSVDNLIENINKQYIRFV